MTRIAYYDLPTISRRDVEASGGNTAGVLHVHAADTPWPGDRGAETYVVPAIRDSSKRTDTMRRIWDLLEQLPQLVYRGVDLREASRYSLLFAVEQAFHQAWVLSHLQSTFGGTIDWYTDSETTASRMQELADQQRLDLRVHCIHPVRTKTLLSRPLDALRTSAWTWRRWLQERRWSRRDDFKASDLPSGRRPIVFAEYFPNSARVSLAIARQLCDHPELQPVYISSRLEVPQVAAAAGIPSVLLRDFRRGNPASRRGLRAGWEAAFEQLAQAPIRLVEGGPDCRSLLLSALRSEACRQFAVAVELIEDAEAMVERLRPAALCTTTWLSTFGRTMTAAAAARGVPTAWIQHGLCFDKPEFIHMASDACLVWGEVDRRRLTEAGIAGNVHVIGAPHFDGFLERVHRAGQRPPPDGSTMNVLYLASRTGGIWVAEATAERLIVSVANAVLSHPGATLTIKLHPGDHSGVAQRAVGHLDRVKLVQKGSSQDHILQCDVAIVTSSVTGLEACAADKPLISFTPTSLKDGVDYAGYGAALCATDENELQAALQQIFSGQADAPLRAGRKRLIDDMLDGAGGAAASKGAETLAQLSCAGAKTD